MSLVVLQKLHALTLWGSVVLVCICLSAGSTSFAGIGFYAELENAPAVVSGYDDYAEPFSAALGSRTYAAYFPGGVRFVPRLESSSYEQQSLRFGTYYYLNKRQLVPVSVDVRKYLNFKIQSYDSRHLSDLINKENRLSAEGKRRSGISFGISLPKRFDQMFGEGGANLKVSGYRRISFSGRSQWTDGITSGTFRQSRFPSLNMEQVSRFDISGTIGTKISVRVSQDSQTDIPLANRIQLRYKGDEDDILQVIEAGNTTLNLPNTRFVGYSSRIQGLFGLKAVAQLGNLKLTSILSQEKGSSSRVVISATGEESAQTTRDYQFAEGRIFDLGYADDPDSLRFNKNDSVRQLFIYKHDIRESDSSQSHRMFVDSIGDAESELVATLQVRLDRYQWFDDPVRNQHYVHFNITQRDALGIWMEIARYDDNFNFLRLDTIGSQVNDTFDLRFLRAVSDDYVPTHRTWQLMWRNCYTIPRGSTVEELNLKIFKGLPGREGTAEVLDYQTDLTSTQKYITILGLDQYNDGTGDKIHDNVLDERREIFRPDWGLLIFPDREPFRSTSTFTDQNGKTTQQLRVKVNKMYSYSSPTERSENSQYYIQVSSRSRSSNIRLNRANIIEGSERVTLNGRPLTRGVDYNIEYGFGQITLLSDEATDPNADLQIEFEYAPFFAIQKKTLFGLRAEYEWNKNLKFGTTLLFKTDKQQDRKPRVGQETAKAAVYDFDFSWRLQPNFLSKAVNALPLISTEAQSSMQITAEVAQSRPNPNVGGEAFIDDFESATEHISLGLTRTAWHIAAKPVEIKERGDATRGKMLWHQIGTVDRTDVFNAENRPGEGFINPLRLIFRPENKFSYDVAGNIENLTPDSSSTKWWNGITRYLGNRLDAKRLQLFELRVRIGENGRKGKLHLDFGRISEDVIDNLSHDTEDLNNNQFVEPEEDLGLDGLADFAEDTSYNAETNPDPSGDNWFHQGQGVCPLPASQCVPAFIEQLKTPGHPLFFEWLNGTEGNRDDIEFLGEPDRERLSNGGHNLTDAYFSFVIDLNDPNSPFLDTNSYSEDRNWVTYQIPIRDPAISTLTQTGSAVPDWSQISHARVWYEESGSSKAYDTLDIAAWYFVQSNWQDSLITSGDSAQFFVSGISEDQNSKFESSGLDALYPAYENPTDGIKEVRRALNLKYENLVEHDTGFVTKNLFTAESYSGYRRLEMYVHADNNVANDSIYFFFQLGRDSVNFYEYKTRLQPGWNTGNFVNIDFNEITALKDAYLRGHEDPQTVVDTTAGKYRVFGRPNINQIQFFKAGIFIDTSDTFGKEASGEIWIDELRLTDVRNDVGNAVRANISGSLADLITYNASIEHKDPFFRGISSATRGGGTNNLGSGRTDNRISYSFTLNTDKFLPKSWRSRIPITYSYSKSTQIPLLRTNTDIVLQQEIRNAETSESISRSLRISESFNMSGDNPLFKYFLNKQRVSMSYTRSRRSSPTIQSHFTENYSLRGNYSMGSRNFPRLPLLFWVKSIPMLGKLSGTTLGLYPDTWRLTADFNRKLTISEDTKDNPVTSRIRDFNGSMNLSYRLIENLGTSFSYSTSRDLIDPRLVSLKLSDFRLGLETNFRQSFKADYSPSIFRFVSHAFSYSANYTDIYDRSSRTRRSDLSRKWSVGGQFEHIALLGGKSSGRSRSGRGRSTTGGRRNVRSADKSEKPFYDPPLAVLRYLTQWINPTKYNYSKSFNNSVPAMLLRPSLKYRLGFQDDAQVPLGSDVRVPSSGERKAFTVSSGFVLFGGVSTDVSFRRQVTEDLIRVGGRHLKTSTSWPDLKIRITRFKTLPLIKPYVNKIIDIFAPRTAYSRSTQVEKNLELIGVGNKDVLTKDITTIDRNPLISINFRLFRSLSMSANYAVKQSNNKRYSPTKAAETKETNNIQRTLGISTKYAFTAPTGLGIPLLGRIKFRSTVSIDLNIRFTSKFTETQTNDKKDNNGNQVFVPTRDQNELSISPVISYTFSQQIRGGITALWQDNSNKMGRSSHVRQLQIWTEIRF